LFSERERRVDRRARAIIVAVFSGLSYALLWHWGWLGGSPGGVALFIAVPVLLGFIALINNPVELAFVCVILLVLLALGLPVFQQTQIRRQETIELSHGRDVVRALLQYAHAHQDRFPGKLADVTPDGIPAEARHFHDPKTRQESDWLYYGSDRRDPISSPSPPTLLLASPAILTNRPKRLVIFSDGGAQLIGEEEFARLLPQHPPAP